MKDVVDELLAVHRTMGKGSVPAGEAYTVELRRRYDAEIENVWDAITSAERLPRWLVPVTGDLRLGGKYELEGMAHGEILRCESPRLLKVSWLYGPDADAWEGTSEVEVRLTPGPAGDTEIELIHAAVVDPHFFPTYGPGAGGVGWTWASSPWPGSWPATRSRTWTSSGSHRKGANSAGVAPRRGVRLISTPAATQSRWRPRSRRRRRSTYPTEGRSTALTAGPQRCAGAVGVPRQLSTVC